MVHDSVIILRDSHGGNITSLHLNDTQTQELLKIMLTEYPFKEKVSLQKIIH